MSNELRREVINKPNCPIIQSVQFLKNLKLNLKSILGTSDRKLYLKKLNLQIK